MNNTFKLFYRSLKRRKIFSVITIGGYAISMAVLLILITFILGERNVNRGFENSKYIYRIVRSDNESIVPVTLQNDLKAKVPGIEKMCLYAIQKKLYKVGNQQEWGRMMAANDDFMDMFSFQFIYKSSEPTLSVKNNIILTKKFSEKLFGANNPVGEILEVDNNIYNIAGVISNIPDFASFNFDFLIDNEDFYVVNMGFHDENHKLLNAFVMLNRNADYETVNSQVTNLINHWQVFKDIKLSLEPLNKIYFHNFEYDGLNHANVKLIYLLASIAGIILFMTVFNYINLAVSGSYERLNEIGIKRTTGADRKDIFKQVLSESMFVSLLALILSLFLVLIISPFFTNILGKKIELISILTEPMVLIPAVIIFFFTAILAGVYPALAFSGISPLQVISNRSIVRKKGQRAEIISLQFFITTVLLISLIVVQKQVNFLKFTDPGFDSEMMVRLELKGNSSSKWDVIKEKLLQYPQVISASASFGSPMHLPGWSSGESDINGVKKTIVTKSFWADPDFIKTFGLSIVQGRNFYPNDSTQVIINEHLYKALEWTDLDGKTYGGGDVIGVIKDFHYENLYNEVGNLQIGKIQSGASILNIKIKGDVAENLDLIKNVYTEIEPEIPFTFKFYNDWLQSMYQKEEKQAKAISVFAVIAIIISCLGLVGLTELITKRRVKEIGIRKISGAKTGEVLALLNRNVAKWILCGFIIACPVAFFLMYKWLENFAYKTNLSWWIFAFAGVVALGIALLTVSFQSWKAATKNPVESLRYE
ncbi:MAG: FtsX-like permease family protein [Prolixibacteraceae bacterium]|nr:FtsX-like permease family protein [Prolixibacteraceae bacterium]